MESCLNGPTAFYQQVCGSKTKRCISKGAENKTFLSINPRPQPPLFPPALPVQDVISLGIEGAAVCNVPFKPEAPHH